MNRTGKIGLTIIAVIVIIIAMKFCDPKQEDKINSKKILNKVSFVHSKKPDTISIHWNVRIEEYFQFMDSLVEAHDSLTSYLLTEHLLVRANPWIIDTLSHTDYYLMKARDSFVYEQKQLIVLPKGAKLTIPDSTAAQDLLKAFDNTIIDVNIPEFKLRIYEDSTQLYHFPIRVGRNEKKYLAMSGRVQDLKTKTGEGYIVKHIRDPIYVNPVDNHEYDVTRRDDHEVTKLPQIPFIEAELNGLRYGQLIHPTTNPETLGKAYSNGCIGTSEAAAWVIYYYAPIDAKIRIRYDLKVVTENEGKQWLNDIYGLEKE